MKLKVSKNTAEELLRIQLTDGYRLLLRCENDRMQKKKSVTWNPRADTSTQRGWLDDWFRATASVIDLIFPTELERFEFIRPHAVPSASRYIEDHEWYMLCNDIQLHLQALRAVLDERTQRYPFMPTEARLYVEDIDSFVKVREVNPALVTPSLQKGRLELSENEVQLALEQILDVPFHQEDWGGETNDLYTANVVVNGRRRCTAFMLKGKGLGGKKMEIKNCGKQGDQLLRLVRCASAELFIVQFVGEVSQAVVDDIHDKVLRLRTGGRDVCYLIMDALDTARVLFAYGKLPVATSFDANKAS